MASPQHTSARSRTSHSAKPPDAGVRTLENSVRILTIEDPNMAEHKLGTARWRKRNPKRPNWLEHEGMRAVAQEEPRTTQHASAPPQQTHKNKAGANQRPAPPPENKSDPRICVPPHAIPSRAPPPATNSSRQSLPIRSMSSNNNLAGHDTPGNDVQSSVPSIHSNDPQPGRHRDKVVPPSAASGGVPQPSPLYLWNCARPPQLTPYPQDLLIILDLNGTLLYRPKSNRPTHFVARPFAQKFLSYVLSNFHVMVWSSAQPKNVEVMCQRLFTPQDRSQLLGLWARDKLGLSKEDFGKRVQVYKRLDRIWSDPEIQAKHPWAAQGGRWHQGNTVLLDDSVEKSRSEPHNFVEIIEFTGAPENEHILRNVAEYLSTLRMQADVSSYIRQYPLRIVRETGHGV